MHRVAFAVLIASATNAGGQKPTPTIELRPGLVITQSVRIAPRTYRLAASSSLDSAVVTIRGDDITVDFAGASLAGLDPAADPDQARGIGVRVDGGRNVRVVNATVRGYKVGLLAHGTRTLTLARDDFGHNWKPRLYSAIEHESLVDWLSHHHNEQREWLRFGAGVYLEDIRGGEIRDVRIAQGMEGLMLVRSDSLRIWNNVIEFNSGVGIGLYRSSDNVIMHNRASYNVRGYSHGFYRRGQDSADLLLYEQSCRNVVAYNSMTHGGDGLFLWAGQSTMDTGEGGSNDNLFYANDFSFAPTNGMEATFSRNVFAENRVEGSDYGLWAGYSFESRIVGNHFTRNRTGVAIEHGQNNTIARNVFDGDTVAVNLWANPIEPGDWGYPKHRDTRSRDYVVADNTFTGNRVGVRSANTTGTMVANRFTRVDSAVVRVDTSALRETGGGADIAPTVAPAPIAGGVDARALDSLASRDRSAIVVDEWGPYDWRSPKLWPVDSGRGTAVRLRVLGPAGRWRVVGRRAARRANASRHSIPVLIFPFRGTRRLAHRRLPVDRRRGPAHAPRRVRRPCARHALGDTRPASARHDVVSPRDRRRACHEVGSCGHDHVGARLGHLHATHDQRRRRSRLARRQGGDRRLDAPRVARGQCADRAGSAYAARGVLPSRRLDRAACGRSARAAAVDGFARAPLARPGIGVESACGFADARVDHHIRASPTRALIIPSSDAPVERTSSAPQDFSGRVAIVTGAARGLGRAAAERLYERGAGVVVNVRDVARADALAESLGERALSVPGDITAEGMPEEIVRRTLERFGRIDILVNNAAFARSTRFPKLSAEEFREALEVNMTAPFLLTKAALPTMQAQHYGRIINISSSAGRMVSTLGGAHYTASKAGLLGLTRAAAKELGKFGITVNAICPGMIDTELTHENASPDLLERLAAGYPVPRLGTALEVADLICFAASEAAGYITGTSLDINGGDLMM